MFSEIQNMKTTNLIEMKSKISKRHYILKANKGKFFFNTWPKSLEKYKRKFGEDFSLILVKSVLGDKEEFYTIPYSELKNVFVKKNLVRWQKVECARWLGNINKWCS